MSARTDAVTRLRLEDHSFPAKEIRTDFASTEDQHRGSVIAARWGDRIFAAMARNAGNVTDYFNIPTNRVVELGTRVEI